MEYYAASKENFDPNILFWKDVHDILLKKKGNIFRVTCHFKRYKIKNSLCCCVCVLVRVCTFVSAYICLGTEVEGCTTGEGKASE